MKKYLLAGALSTLLVSCEGQNARTAGDARIEPVSIIRFDKALFRLVESGDTALWPGLADQYPEMLRVLGQGVLNLRSAEAPGFLGKTLRYYSEPTLRALYRDAIERYDSIPDIERALGQGFAYLRTHFPTARIPAVYMHVSGLNHNVLAGDSLLSLSIDKYMGADYPLYQEFFYDAQRSLMRPELVAPDYIAGWLMSEFPFEGRENVLLDRMVYEGKIKYLVAEALGIDDEALLMGYTPEALEWCERHEGAIWTGMIERKHLYTPDLLTTSQYFEDAPAAVLAEGAPGRPGVWIGWQIVRRYMKETGSTPEALMRNTDAQAILTGSKYKPQ